MVKPQLPGALHFVTGNCINRFPVFIEPECCRAFLDQLKALNQSWPSKLIAYVLMPDHFHFIANPRDGRIIEFCRDLKSKAAKAIVEGTRRFRFPKMVVAGGFGEVVKGDEGVRLALILEER